MPELDDRYTSRFFTGNAVSAAKSAEPVLKILFDLYSPKSVVDIGCGSGGWLAAAERLGAEYVRGYDGPWADPARYTSPTINFTPVDLEKSTFEHDRRYDLAMSVEVAEHLSESRSELFVDWLTQGSDVVMFGAAVPLQGGVHHINEKPLTFWMEKFKARGYEPFDIIRPAVWDNDQIAYWFRQNTILYVKEGSDVLDRDKLRSMETHVWDIVHPANYQKKVRGLRKTQARLNRLTARQKAQQTAHVKGGNVELKRRLYKKNQRIEQLERQLALPAWKRQLSKTSISKLPAPLQGVARSTWRSLPASTRSSIRDARKGR